MCTDYFLFLLKLKCIKCLVLLWFLILGNLFFRRIGKTTKCFNSYKVIS